MVWYCDQCNEENAYEAACCEFCGSPKSRGDNEELECPDCGHMTRISEEKCPNCGRADFIETRQAEIEEEFERYKSTRKYRARGYRNHTSEDSLKGMIWTLIIFLLMFVFGYFVAGELSWWGPA